MTHREWTPPNLDVSVPSIARLYDFFLGGTHNFPVDRELAASIDRAVPDARVTARLSRAFLRRAVEHMIEEGVRQFLDIGSGIPTEANVHEVAQSAAPETRVVYVDKDPSAVAHSELLLADNDLATVVHADMRDPESILDHPETRRLLDFDQPIGMLVLMMLHWLPDEADPWALVARYREALPPGSFLAITHISGDNRDPGLAVATDAIKQSPSADQLNERSHAKVLELFGDFQLVEPGLVDCSVWRSAGNRDEADASAAETFIYGGVGRKR
jgi:hypothetical protein